jgi:hypothetical protein
VIANDRRIVGTTRAHAQQSQDNQGDTERLHALMLVQMLRAATGIRRDTAALSVLSTKTWMPTSVRMTGRRDARSALRSKTLRRHDG